MRIAVLGPGGVGGLLAGALARAGEEVTVLARQSTAASIAAAGVSVDSVLLGRFVARPEVTSRLAEDVDALLVATKAGGLDAALERVEGSPRTVLPLLNGLDHIARLRERFAPETVLAGSIRVEADRPQPGVIMHTSPFLLVSMASRFAAAAGPMEELAAALTRAGVPAGVQMPVSARSEAEVMWSKLVRLNALACMTSAYDKLLGEIRTTPALRAQLEAAMEEAGAVAHAEGAREVSAQKAMAELERAHETLGSSMQRDIAAGREPELDAIPGSVLRAGARHGLPCPTIERLVLIIAERAGLPPPAIPLPAGGPAG